MSKFCSKCGKELKDGARFCAGCGNQIEEKVPSTKTKNEVDVKKKAYKNVYLKLAITAIAIVLVFLGTRNVMGEGYKTPINQLVEGINTGNNKLILQAFDSENQAGISSDFVQQIALNGAGDYKYSVKFVNKKELEAEAVTDEYYKNLFVSRVDRIIFTKAYKVTVRINQTNKITKKKAEGLTTFIVAKTDGKWIITRTALDEFIYGDIL